MGREGRELAAATKSLYDQICHEERYGERDGRMHDVIDLVTQDCKIAGVGQCCRQSVMFLVGQKVVPAVCVDFYESSVHLDMSSNFRECRYQAWPYSVSAGNGRLYAMEALVMLTGSGLRRVGELLIRWSVYMREA
jgi:hypothetical protein